MSPPAFDPRARVVEVWDAIESHRDAVLDAFAHELAGDVAAGLRAEKPSRVVLVGMAIFHGGDEFAVRVSFDETLRRLRDEAALVEARPDATVIAAQIVADGEKFRSGAA